MAITDVKSALPTPFATLAEADAYLNSTEIWFENDDELKEEALGWSQTYLDANYTFFAYDENDIPNQLKLANILLANEHFNGNLFTRQSGTDPLEEIEVVAGSVSTRKRYSARTSWFDPFPEITSILTGYARLSPKSSDQPIVRA